MKTFNLDKRGDTPLYEYLYKCIREEIQKGNLKSGEKLPSKRNLAGLYDVSLITVENAYEQLIIEGYIKAVEKKGYYVSDISPVVIFEKKKERNIKETKKNVTDLSLGRIQYDNFPFSTWAGIMRKTLLDGEGEFLKSLDNKGVYELREAIAEQLSSFRGFSCDPENIIIGAGTDYLHFVTAKLVGNEGIYAVEDPGYEKVSQIYLAEGADVEYIPVDEDGLSIDALYKCKKKPTLIHLSPAHQFPTGIVMPAGRRHAIIDYAKKNDCYVIEDDYDSEFRYQGKPIQTMADLDKEHVIYMNTFSRTLSPSVRIAYMVLPDKLCKMFNEKLGFMACPVSGMEQYTLARFIDGGYYGRHINRMKNYYRSHRDSVMEIIGNSKFGKHIKIHEENSGLHFLIEINKKNYNMEAYIKRLAKKDIIIRPVSDYCHGKAGMYKNSLVFNYSDITADKLKECLDIMEECL